MICLGHFLLAIFAFTAQNLCFLEAPKCTQGTCSSGMQRRFRKIACKMRTETGKQRYIRVSFDKGLKHSGVYDYKYTFIHFFKDHFTTNSLNSCLVWLSMYISCTCSIHNFKMNQPSLWFRIFHKSRFSTNILENNRTVRVPRITWICLRCLDVFLPNGGESWGWIPWFYKQTTIFNKSKVQYIRSWFWANYYSTTIPKSELRTPGHIEKWLSCQRMVQFKPTSGMPSSFPFWKGPNKT